MKAKVRVCVDERALERVARESMRNAVRGGGIDVTCPRCGAEFTLRDGSMSCPECGVEFRLG